MAKGLPTITSLDMLKAFYSELSAARRAYYKTLVRVVLKSGGSYEDAVVHTEERHTRLEKKGHKGAKSVDTIRAFIEFTAGTLYVPMSALGYKQMDYEWALNFKIDCDLARAKTGDISDGAVHYISDIAAGDHIIKRREVLSAMAPRGRPPKKSNYTDIKERYLRLKNTSQEEKKEIEAWLEVNREALDDPQGSFHHEAYTDKVLARSASISSGDVDLDREAFLDWLMNRTMYGRKLPKPTSE